MKALFRLTLGVTFFAAVSVVAAENDGDTYTNKGFSVKAGVGQSEMTSSFMGLLQDMKVIYQNTYKSVGIDATDHVLKVPKATGGGLSEAKLKIGGAYSAEQLMQIFHNNTASAEGATVCPLGQVYETDRFAMSGQVSLLKGIKLGDQVFAYGMIGAEGSGRAETIKGNGPVTGNGMGMGPGLSGSPNSSKTRMMFVYLGAVGEAGLGFKSGQTNVMAGMTLKDGIDVAGSKSDSALPGIGQVDQKVEMGAKVRVAGNNVMAEGEISGQVGGESEQKSGDTEIKGESKLLKYGCEALIRVGRHIALGANVQGTRKSLKTTIREPAEPNSDGTQADPRVYTNAEGKVNDMSIGVRAVFMIPDKFKSGRAK